jgi:hypothetical protein
MRSLIALTAVLFATSPAMADEADFCRSGQTYELRQAIIAFRRCPSVQISRPYARSLDRHTVPMAAMGLLTLCSDEADAAEALILSCANGNREEADARFSPIFRRLFEGAELMITLDRAERQQTAE